MISERFPLAVQKSSQSCAVTMSLYIIPHLLQAQMFFVPKSFAFGIFSPRRWPLWLPAWADMQAVT